MNTYKTQQYPLATVGCVIVNPYKEILLLKSHKWSHLYSIPGGKIHYGESMTEALKREILEETALNVDNIIFVMAQDCIEHHEFYKKQHFILLDFIAHTKDTKVVLNEEAQEYLWNDIKKSLQLPLNEPTKILIEEIIRQKILL